MFKEMNTTYRRTVREGINTDDMTFAPLRDFCGKQLKVDGFFFTDGKFGKQVVVVANGWLVNMPKRAVEVFETIEKDDDMLQAVLNGHLLITDIKPLDSKNGTTTAYTLADC